MKSEVPHAFSGRRSVLLPPLLALALLVMLWWRLDLSSFRSLEQVQAALGELRRDPAAGAYVVGGFALLTTLLFPVTLLVVATVLTFGSLQGFAFAMAGIAAAAASTYWTGRLIGGRALFALAGPRLTRATEALRAHAFWASALARVAPLGNFALINMAAGSMRIPFWAFLTGSSVGAVPGTLLIALFADQARSWLGDSGGFSAARLAWITVGLLVLGLLGRRLLRRRAP